jgi:hypothetical protein
MQLGVVINQPGGSCGLCICTFWGNCQLDVGLEKMLLSRKTFWNPSGDHLIGAYIANVFEAVENV